LGDGQQRSALRLGGVGSERVFLLVAQAVAIGVRSVGGGTRVFRSLEIKLPPAGHRIRGRGDVHRHDIGRGLATEVGDRSGVEFRKIRSRERRMEHREIREAAVHPAIPHAAVRQRADPAKFERRGEIQGEHKLAVAPCQLAIHIKTQRAAAADDGEMMPHPDGDPGFRDQHIARGAGVVAKFHAAAAHRQDQRKRVRPEPGGVA